MNRKEIRLLKYLLSNKQRSVSFPRWIDELTIITLKARGFIGTDVCFESGFITDAGIAGLAEDLEKKSDRRFTRKIAIVTVAVSVLALSVSVLSLLLQFLSR